MQNRYVGDIGDFGKFGLLKTLCQPDEEGNQLSLGVVWYLVPDENHNNDGKHVAYLEPSIGNIANFRECDPVLYDAISNIVRNGERTITSIRQRNLLPRGTAFYEAALTFNDIPNIGSSARKTRIAYRQEWLSGALETTKSCNVVFADPDNGLEVGIERHQAKGPKYVYFDELSPFIKRGQSLIVYHHLCRDGDARTQIKRRLDQLRGMAADTEGIAALQFRRGTARAYFIIPAIEHKTTLSNNIQEFVSGNWGRHFVLHESL
ncbi:MAG: hypothetical protein HZA22_01865 [Nitrospirae bacterium]|nr:hypothetical protein [Nitrospirota bacterium]